MGKIRTDVKGTCANCGDKVAFVTDGIRDEVYIGCKCGNYKVKEEQKPYLPRPSRPMKNRVKVGEIWVD